MDTKLRIKMGAVEVEYEGSDEFLRKELPELLKAVLALHASAANGSDDETASTFTAPKSGQANRATKLSTSTIAGKIGAKSGSDLAMAAAAALVLGEGKESFSRSELLKAMQGAKAYYKASIGSNLSTYLKTLVKAQDLLDHGSDNFGLHDSKRKELEQKLA